MAKKKSVMKGLIKFLDDLSPSKSNPNRTKGSVRKQNSAKRKKAHCSNRLGEQNFLVIIARNY